MKHLKSNQLRRIVMNANLFAVVLSVSIISTTALATVTNQPVPKQPSTVVKAKKINLNIANAETLTKSFKGIGEKRANSIITYRKSHGNFKAIAELASVKGLGKSFVEKYLSQLQNIFSIE
jgi:competence protein ComEA